MGNKVRQSLIINRRSSATGAPLIHRQWQQHVAHMFEPHSRHIVNEIANMLGEVLLIDSLVRSATDCDPCNYFFSVASAAMFNPATEADQINANVSYASNRLKWHDCISCVKRFLINLQVKSRWNLAAV